MRKFFIYYRLNLPECTSEEPVLSRQWFWSCILLYHSLKRVTWASGDKQRSEQACQLLWFLFQGGLSASPAEELDIFMLLSLRYTQLCSTQRLAAAMAPRRILAQKLRGKNPKPLFQSISKFLSVCSFFTFDPDSFRKIRGEAGHERRASHECGEGCFDDSCFGGLAEEGFRVS